MSVNRAREDLSSVRRKSDAYVVKRVLRGKIYERRITSNDLLTCPEVAAYAGWSLRWVYELLRRGDLRAFRQRGHRVIPASEVLRLKESVRRKRLRPARLTLFRKEGG